MVDIFWNIPPHDFHISKGGIQDLENKNLVESRLNVCQFKEFKSLVENYSGRKINV